MIFDDFGLQKVNQIRGQKKLFSKKIHRISRKYQSFIKRSKQKTIPFSFFLSCNKTYSPSFGIPKL